MSDLITSTNMSWRYAPTDFDYTDVSKLERFILDFVDDYCDRLWYEHDEDPTVEFGSPEFSVNISEEHGRLYILVGISSYSAAIGSDPDYSVRSWRLSIGEHSGVGPTDAVSLAEVVDFIGSPALETLLTSSETLDQISAAITARRAA